MYQLPQTKSFTLGASGTTSGRGCRIHHVIVASVIGAVVSFYSGTDNTGVLKLNVVVAANGTVPIQLGKGIDFDAGLYWTATANSYVTVQGEGNLS